MSFGLKNVGATYQRAIQKCFKKQLNKNVEAYVDDMVVKTRNSDTLIADLEETFTALREYQRKLNTNKCVFGVPSGKLLGFIVSHRGIEANPEKVSAITNIKAPTYIKDVQKHTWCMAALNRFISKLGERGLPFFKLLEHQEKFVWTPEADQDLAQLKDFLSKPPVLTTPRKKEQLLLYLAATTHVVSTTIVVERQEGSHAYPVHRPVCRMDLPGPTTSVGTRTDYSVGPWDYPACATRHLKAWSTRTAEEKYSVRKLYMSCTIWKTPRRTRQVLSPYSDL
jgi:hypothetical protein